MVLLSLMVAVAPAAARQRPSPSPPDGQVAQDLKRLSIEELAELDVTSVSRRVERLAQTAAAVSVVRQDDIRRTGVALLPEALRLADGIDVARSDGRTWNITARGFNIVTTNKLLVLMDGRTLYSPLFSGTFWDVHDPVLADLDRIEVIRGPGGSVWGANAVNGVINIISKSAADTRGAHVVIAGGTENQLITTARYGARTPGDGSYRVFG
jgi:iron complex outermembrane receptor protein